jgi:hypothetical protein
VLTPFDDYPIHQTGEPLASVAGGHPNHYDRFFFNGYTESMYFAVALGIYPNRGVIDAAFAVVHDGIQRSVFASGRAPLDRTQTRIGPIQLDIVEPLRITRIRVDAPEHGLTADLLAHARTPACEESRATSYEASRQVMDRSRAVQMLTWTGELSMAGRPLELPSLVYGTKDRSWGIRLVGDPIPAAPPPNPERRGTLFLWAPLNFADRCLHYAVYEDIEGRPWSQTSLELPVIGPDGEVCVPDSAIRRLGSIEHRVRWAPGLRRSNGATLLLNSEAPVELEPLLAFRMKGVGYQHPTWNHGRWHDELAVGGEVHTVDELDTLAPDCLHIQQVVRATWGNHTGLGVLEQAVVGPYRPAGFRAMFDGAPAIDSRPEPVPR